MDSTTPKRGQRSVKVTVHKCTDSDGIYANEKQLVTKCLKELEMIINSEKNEFNAFNVLVSLAINLITHAFINNLDDDTQGLEASLTTLTKHMKEHVRKSCTQYNRKTRNQTPKETTTETT